MKFVRETHSSLTIHQVDEGVIRIGDEKIRENVVLFRDTIERGWMVDDVSKLVESDFATLIEKSPEIVIFGTGWTPKLPPRDLVFALARRGIGFEMMGTPAACRTFNVLISEDRDVAAVLLINSTDP